METISPDVGSWLLLIWLIWVGVDRWRQFRLSLPGPDEVPFHAIAWLRDGWRGVIQLAIFQLWQQQQVAIRSEHGVILLQSLPTRPGLQGALLHRMLHQYLRRECGLRALLADRALQRQCAVPTREYESHLLRLGLWRGREGRRLLLAKAAVFGLALILEWWTGQDDAILLLLAGVVMVAWLRPWRMDWPTVLGKRLLKQVTAWFRWTLPLLRQRRAPPKVEPELLVALYGLAGAAFLLPPQQGEEGESDGVSSSVGGCGFLDLTDSSAGDGGGGDGGGDGGGCGGGCGGGD